MQIIRRRTVQTAIVYCITNIFLTWNVKMILTFILSVTQKANDLFLKSRQELSWNTVTVVPENYGRVILIFSIKILVSC